jgi:hypothetical protein
VRIEHVQHFRDARITHAKVANPTTLLTRFAEELRRAPEPGKMPDLHSAKSGEEFRTIDNLVLGDCAEEGGQSADA